MNLIKLNMLIIVLLCGFNNTTFAQSADDKIKMQTEMKELVQSLNLSEDQRVKFIGIQKNFGEKMNKLKNEGVSKFKLYSAFKKNKSERNEQMRNILSPAQYELYLEKMTEIEQRRKQRN